MYNRRANHARRNISLFDFVLPLALWRSRSVVQNIINIPFYFFNGGGFIPQL